jgi:hypothetical protein
VVRFLLQNPSEEVGHAQRENHEANALDAAHACDKTEARQFGQTPPLVCAGDRDE